MNRKDLEEAKYLLEINSVDRVTKIALEAIDAQLALLEPKPRVPPEGMVIQVGKESAHLLRYSRGRLDSTGNIMVETDSEGSGYAWTRWSYVPNMLFFRPHDGSARCPCEKDRAIVQAWADGNGLGLRVCTTQDPNQAIWRNIDAWAYLDELKIE